MGSRPERASPGVVTKRPVKLSFHFRTPRSGNKFNLLLLTYSAPKQPFPVCRFPSMSDLLETVTNSCRKALAATQDVSARAPGTPATQALMMGALLGFVTYNLRKKRYRLPPGPWAWPLLGNIKDVASKDVSFYVTLTRWTEKYGPVISVYMGNELCVTLNNLDVITEALVHKGMNSPLKTTYSNTFLMYFSSHCLQLLLGI